MPKYHRTWIEISRQALLGNLSVTQRLVGSSVKIMPIVKANAYGHGLAEALQILHGKQHWGIGLAYGAEALQARELHYQGRIVVLSNWQPQDLPALIRRDVELVVWDEPSFVRLLGVAKLTAKHPRVHIKLDTGTTRIGFLPNQLLTVRKILQHQGLRVVGVFSHFANAEEQSTRGTIQQIRRFTTLCDQLNINGHTRGVDRHIACTAAILRYPEARFGLVRLGIGLYGNLPSPEIQDWVKANKPTIRLQPVLSWYTRIVQMKHVPAGTAIGYGSSFKTKRATTVGLLPIGYADGYDRRLSNVGFVMIKGYRAPIIGRICMNLCMIDLTGRPGMKVNDRVQVIGAGVSADDMAALAGTIPYEIITRINWSIPRLIV